MLRLNINQEKQITFEVQIGGINYDQVESRFNIIIGEIEYSFPAKVGPDTITVNLPSLNKIVGTKIHEECEAEVKLEVIADGHYSTPWKDKATLLNPVVIEVKLKDPELEVISKPTLKTKVIIDENNQVVTSKENKKVVSKECNRVHKEDEDQEPEKKEKELEETIEDRTEALEKLLNNTINKFKLSGNKKFTKKTGLTEFKKNLTKEDVFRYIEKKGTKKPEVQEIIYEQARKVAKNDNPAYILVEVYKILKK